MPTRDEWIAIGLLLGAIAVVGIGIFVLRKKASPQRIQLRRVSEPKIVYQNIERRVIERDREGNLKAIVIHRQVKRDD